jgi:hypothetical protein
MHNSPHERNNLSIPAAPGAGQTRCYSMQFTLTMNGSFFTLHGDRKEAVGFEIHLVTDATDAELIIKDGSAAPSLRIFQDRSA